MGSLSEIDGLESAHGEAAAILSQAVAEIRKVRSKLGLCHSAVDVDIALKRAEAQLINKSKEKVNLELENVSSNIGKKVLCEETRARLVPRPKPRRSGFKPAGPSAGEDLESLARKYIENPTSLAAREYFQDRYGIEPPQEQIDSNIGAQRAQRIDSVKKGLACQQPFILPGWIRDDPFEHPPPEISSQELHKGIFHLINKRLLPHYVDIGAAISGSSWIVRTLSAYLHPFELRHSRKAVTSALEDSILALGSKDFKLDVLTPIRMPQMGRIQPAENSNNSCSDDEATRPGSALGKTSSGPREFSDLMDDHSLHHIMIRRGVVVDTTPEFTSFHRTYTDIWPFIADIILQLEGICSHYAIPIAVLDGRAIADTVKVTLGIGEPCPMEDLLSCVVNIQEVAMVLRQPGRRFLGVNGKQEAATMIQSRFRGFKARSKNPRIEKLRAAAKSIQEAWRLNRIRVAAIQKIRKYEAKVIIINVYYRLREKRNALSKDLQERFTKEWQSTQKQSHVVVHIPSVSGRELADLRSEHQEILQMARLCDTADTDVDVIYIAAIEVDREVEGYWRKLLEVGGVEDPERRYRIIHPENTSRLPPHMSLTAKLLSSPRALQRIINFIHGRPAYIVPGIVGDEDITLSVKLNIPLLAPHPHHRHAVMIRSGARAVFKTAGVMTAPSQMFPRIKHSNVDIKTSPLRPGTSFSLNPSGDLVVTEDEQGVESALSRRPRNDGFLLKGISETLIQYPHFQKWSINIDNELWGRGVAHFDLNDMEDVLDAIESYRDISDDPASICTSEEPKNVTVHRLIMALTKSLPKKLKIVRKDFHPSYRAFVQALRTNGGVLEAVPNRTTGCPSVNFFVEPTGDIRVVSTHEQMFFPAHVLVGNSFPQCSIPHIALHDATMAIGEVCYNLGITGHISASFVVFKDGNHLKMWATELYPFPTLSLASYQLFDFLTAGEFDARMGAYLVPDDDESECSFEDKIRKESAENVVHDGGIEVEAQRDTTTAGETSRQDSIMQRRFFVSIDGVTHPLLRKLQYASFFHSCRVHGMCFDMQDRIGTAFNVVDGFASGVLGVLCVGFSPSETFNELCDVLDFISSQVNSLQKQMALKGGIAAEESEGDAKTLNGIRRTVKYFANRLKGRAQDKS